MEKLSNNLNISFSDNKETETKEEIKINTKNTTDNDISFEERLINLK